MDEREIITACAESLKHILTVAQQTLFYLDDKDQELSSLREKFKVLSFKPRQESEQTIGENFTEQEILKMPKAFRPIFRSGKIKASVRKKQNGTYEIRCQINGEKLSASSKNLAEAKLKFIEKLKFLQPPTFERKQKANFKRYCTQWLETVKKPYIKEATYKLYLQVFNAYVFPAFGDRNIATIKTLELQEFINSFTKTERFRTAQKVYQTLSAVFAYAVSDEKIMRSPMDKIVVGYYEQEHGTPLTRSEEADFIRAFMGDPGVYRQAFAFILYTGLRRSELSSVTVSDKWITVTTSKQRKGKKEKQRRIPISPMLRKILPLIDVAAIKALSVGSLTKWFKVYCPSHHLHDLRHTFITRCQECGIQRELVSLWAGHAADSSITSAVYTHLEQFEDRQLEEMQKFIYDF